MWDVLAVLLSASALGVLLLTLGLVVRTFNCVARVDYKLDVLLKNSGLELR